MPLSSCLPEPTDPDSRRRLEAELGDFYRERLADLAKHRVMPVSAQLAELFQMFREYAPLSTARQRMDADLAEAELRTMSLNDHARFLDPGVADSLTPTEVRRNVEYLTDLTRHRYTRFTEAADESAAEERLREKYPTVQQELDRAFHDARWAPPQDKLPAGEQP
jgi:hypothetical protein